MHRYQNRGDGGVLTVMADHEDRWRQFYFPPMCSNEHISKEQSAYSRTEHKCAKVGGDRHDGCTVVDDGSRKITQMYLLTMCLNMHRYESTSTGVRDGCQGGCTLMCSNVLVSKQKSKRGLSGRVHSG